MKERPAPVKRMLLVCCNERPPGEDACANRGGDKIRQELKEKVKAMGLAGQCRVTRAMCLGLCKEGPNICVMPENVWLRDVTPGDIPAILETYVKPLAP